jgi:hypothetical protein
MNTQRELATRRGANGLAIVTTVTAIFAGVRGGCLVDVFIDGLSRRPDKRHDQQARDAD